MKKGTRKRKSKVYEKKREKETPNCPLKAQNSHIHSKKNPLDFSAYPSFLITLCAFPYFIMRSTPEVGVRKKSKKMSAFQEKLKTISTGLK